MNLATVRTLTVKMQTEGADRARSDLDSVTNADERRAKAATATATVVEQSARRQLSATAALERAMKAVDADFRQKQAFDRASGTFDRALNQGIIDHAERARLNDLAVARYTPKVGNDNDPTRKGLSTYDKQFIRYQGFDVASTLGSGGSLTTAAFQQGPQLLQQLADRDGGLKAGLKELGVSAMGLVTPFTIGATAVAGLGIAFGVAATQASRDREMLEKATQGVGAATGATVSQLDALARSSAEGSKASTSAAREYVATYASLGTLAVPVIGELTRLTSEYARVTGQEGAQAATELGRAVADGGAALDAVATKLGGLDDRTRQFIETQREQGDRSGAQAAAAEYLKGTIEANTAATTGWASAWAVAAKAADSYWESAKRIAGIKLGIVPEGAAEAVARLQASVDATNRTRQAMGMDPLNGANSEQARQLATAKVIADQERMIAEGKAAEERADKASRAAGDVTRAYDPNFARLGELRRQQGDLRDALADPLARSKLADQSETEKAYTAATRAIDSMTDSTGKLVDRQEMARRADQLRLDALKATTDGEKAAVAQRQKAFDLIGKTITVGDAAEQIKMAGKLSLAGASDKSKGGGSTSDSADDFDRATKSLEDRIRRQQQDTETYGMGAAAVARYRAETDLLTAAKRAERDITPDLTASIKAYADQASEAAKQQEAMRESMQSIDAYRNVGSEGLRSVIGDLTKGASAADLMRNATSRLTNSLANMASDQIAEGIFGKRGTSGGWLSDLLKPSTGAAAAPGADAGLLSSIKSFLGFDSGGYTGMGPRLEPAGIVHRGEYVFDASATARIGVSTLEAMRSGRAGYDRGGYVGYSADDLRSAQGAATAASGGTVSLQIVNNGTPQEVQEVKEVQDGRGNRTITAQTRDMVASALQQPGSARQAAQRAARDRPVST